MKRGAPPEGRAGIDLDGLRGGENPRVGLAVVLSDRSEVLSHYELVCMDEFELDDLFSPEKSKGGFHKKFFQAISRLVALAREGVSLVT